EERGPGELAVIGRQRNAEPVAGQSTEPATERDRHEDRSVPAHQFATLRAHPEIDIRVDGAFQLDLAAHTYLLLHGGLSTLSESSRARGQPALQFSETEPASPPAASTNATGRVETRTGPFGAAHPCRSAWRTNHTIGSRQFAGDTPEKA